MSGFGGDGSGRERGTRLGDRLGTFEATLEVVRDLCSRYPDARVLDVGCGDGRLLVGLGGSIGAGLGIDVSGEAVRSALRRSNGAGRQHVRFRALPVERLRRSEEGTFDLVIFQGALEHVVDAEGALRRAREVLSESGRVVVVAISPAAPHAIVSRWWLRWTETPVQMHLGVKGVRKLASRAGLRAEEVRPLRRGGAGIGRFGDRWWRRVLGAYDRIGGSTCAVILAPMGG